MEKKLYFCQVTYGEWINGSGYSFYTELDEGNTDIEYPEELTAYDAIQWIKGDSGYDPETYSGSYDDSDTRYTISFYPPDEEGCYDLGEEPEHKLIFWESDLYEALMAVNAE